MTDEKKKILEDMAKFLANPVARRKIARSLVKAKKQADKFVAASKVERSALDVPFTV